MWPIRWGSPFFQKSVLGLVISPGGAGFQHFSSPQLCVTEIKFQVIVTKILRAPFLYLVCTGRMEALPQEQWVLITDHLCPSLLTGYMFYARRGTPKREATVPGTSKTVTLRKMGHVPTFSSAQEILPRAKVGYKKRGFRSSPQRD